MPKTELTAEVKRDMDLIKLRTVLDPKRFYKKDKRKGYPEYSQVNNAPRSASFDSSANFQ